METLFHYCPASSFASIISGKSIWLSSLSLSNDTMEGRLVTQTFEGLLSQSTVSTEEIEEIRKALHLIEDLFDGLGFCLSEKPDLLSQWRGYADDGQGLSIGFSKNYLEELRKSNENSGANFIIDKVLYDPAEQEAALKPTYDEVMRFVESNNLKKPKVNALLSSLKELQQREDEYQEAIGTITTSLLLSTVFQIHMLKNEAFAEEVEWRLVSYLSKNKNAGDSINFRAAGNKLIPYREFKLKQLSIKAISEVYIGPKNITPTFVIEKFLYLNGFRDVSVKRSAASYR